MDGADYSQFRDILGKSAEAAECEVLALLMLPNAYWVLAKPVNADGIARMMQRTGRCYVRYCNEKYRREGTLWASRYRACLVEPKQDTLQLFLEYLEHTPQRAGVVAPGTQWPWLFTASQDWKSGSATDGQSYDAITATLEKGLVYGGDSFRKRIAAELGIRTEPGLRGRPRKRVAQ